VVHLLPLLFDFALPYTIKRVQVNQDGLKLNGTHQLLVYADNVIILVGNIHTVKENTEALGVAETDETKYVVVSGDQNVGQSHSIKIDNSSLVRLEEFKYLETTLTNQNNIQ
jgi:hypothetical protein